MGTVGTRVREVKEQRPVRRRFRTAQGSQRGAASRSIGDRLTVLAAPSGIHVQGAESEPDSSARLSRALSVGDNPPGTTTQVNAREGLAGAGREDAAVTVCRCSDPAIAFRTFRSGRLLEMRPVR